MRHRVSRLPTVGNDLCCPWGWGGVAGGSIVGAGVARLPSAMRVGCRRNRCLAGDARRRWSFKRTWLGIEDKLRPTGPELHHITWAESDRGGDALPVDIDAVVTTEVVYGANRRMTTLEGNWGLVSPDEVIAIRVIKDLAICIAPNPDFSSVSCWKRLSLIGPRTADVAQNSFGTVPGQVYAEADIVMPIRAGERFFPTAQLFPQLFPTLMDGKGTA